MADSNVNTSISDLQRQGTAAHDYVVASTPNTRRTSAGSADNNNNIMADQPQESRDSPVQPQSSDSARKSRPGRPDYGMLCYNIHVSLGWLAYSELQAQYKARPARARPASIRKHLDDPFL